MRRINFVWGKPAPSLLPVAGLLLAIHDVLIDPAAATDALEYGDPPSMAPRVPDNEGAPQPTTNPADPARKTVKVHAPYLTLSLCPPSLSNRIGPARCPERRELVAFWPAASTPSSSLMR